MTGPTGAGVVPFILGVDVEPDRFSIDRMARAPWTGFVRWATCVNALRPRLAAATGAPVHITWFLRMDPQVADGYGTPAWVAEAYGDLLAGFRAEGDCLALHPHAWHWEEPPGRWVADHGDPAWVEHAIRTSFAAYEQAFGEPCLVHRFGDWFIDAGVMAVLRDLGVPYDMTVEPGARGEHAAHAESGATGTIPDHADAPRHPYRPSAHDPMIPAAPAGDDADGLWEIPMTWFDGDSLMPLHRRVARRVRDRGRPRHRPMSLGRPWDARGFWRLAGSTWTRPGLAASPSRCEATRPSDPKSGRSSNPSWKPCCATP